MSLNATPVFEVQLTGYETRFELITLEPVTVFNLRVRYGGDVWETSRRVSVCLRSARRARAVAVEPFPDSRNFAMPECS